MNDVFLALGDPTRREILRLLKQGDRTAGELAQRFPLAKSTLSGHFRVLKHAGLIVAEKNGTSIVYSLNVSAAQEALSATLELLGVGKGTKKKARPERAVTKQFNTPVPKAAATKPKAPKP